MDAFKNYTQLELWNMLPISVEQRERIIEDFIKTDQYDKIPEERMKCDDMKDKDQPVNDTSKEKVI